MVCPMRSLPWVPKPMSAQSINNSEQSERKSTDGDSSAVTHTNVDNRACRHVIIEDDNPEKRNMNALCIPILARLGSISFGSGMWTTPLRIDLASVLSTRLRIAK